MLCTEIRNTHLLNDVKIKQLITSYAEDMEWEFEKPIFKMMTYFENRKTISFYVFCLNFNIEIKTKTWFLICNFKLSKKKKNRNGTLGTRIPFASKEAN